MIVIIKCGCKHVSFKISFKAIKFAQERRESGRLRQTAAEECLKPREANTVVFVVLSHIKYFDDERRARAGS